VDQYKFSPDGATIVYIADQDVNMAHDLYAVDVTDPGVSTKLNPPLVADGDLCTFDFSPDSTKGVSVKINGTLPAGGDVSVFAINPDGLQLTYAADQDTEGVADLYNVDLSTTHGTCPAATTPDPCFRHRWQFAWNGGL
jgi:Tol biopolymer transport system component